MLGCNCIKYFNKKINKLDKISYFEFMTKIKKRNNKSNNNETIDNKSNIINNDSNNIIISNNNHDNAENEINNSGLILRSINISSSESDIEIKKNISNNIIYKNKFLYLKEKYCVLENRINKILRKQINKEIILYFHNKNNIVNNDNQDEFLIINT